MADIEIVRGDDFLVNISLVSGGLPFDLTDYTARSQIRTTNAANAPLIAEFTTTIQNPETDGIITIELDHTVTETFTVNGVWDLEIADVNGWVTTVIREGNVAIVPDITRDEP